MVPEEDKKRAAHMPSPLGTLISKVAKYLLKRGYR